MRNTPHWWEVWCLEVSCTRTEVSFGPKGEQVFFSKTLNRDIRACRSFQSWEKSALNARKHKQELKTEKKILEVRRVVPPSFFSFFSMFLNARNCWSLPPTIRFRIFVHANVLVCSALNTPHAERAAMLSQFVFERNVFPFWCTRDFSSSSRVAHLRCQN